RPLGISALPSSKPTILPDSQPPLNLKYAKPAQPQTGPTATGIETKIFCVHNDATVFKATRPNMHSSMSSVSFTVASYEVTPVMQRVGCAQVNGHLKRSDASSMEFFYCGSPKPVGKQSSRRAYLPMHLYQVSARHEGASRITAAMAITVKTKGR
ncbi:hypothetical protein, partial [Deinococcus malanensis]|uniref:hypothetical protein n=1 Tax=Deinococcus malanensis TaxID=1706855 RepID=UPI001E54F0CF